MSRHRFDFFSFLVGAMAVAVAVLAVARPVALTPGDLRLVGPIVLVALGVALLTGSGRDRPRRSDAGRDPASPTATATVDATPDPTPDATAPTTAEGAHGAPHDRADDAWQGVEDGRTPGDEQPR